MTNQELIERLQELPMDGEVMIGASPVADIESTLEYIDTGLDFEELTIIKLIPQCTTQYR